MNMVKASYVPSEYQSLEEEATPRFLSSGRASPIPSVFCSPTSENGWRLTIYKTASQVTEDEADIQDSLEALKEAPGISLEDLKRDLGV
jgi:hypothetical protein